MDASKIMSIEEFIKQARALNMSEKEIQNLVEAEKLAIEFGGHLPLADLLAEHRSISHLTQRTKHLY